MKRFYFKEEAVTELKRQFNYKLLPIVMITLAALMALVHFVFMPLDPIIFFIYVVCIITVRFFVMGSYLKMFKDLNVGIDQDAITRYKGDKLDSTLKISEIIEIKKFRNGGILLKSKNRKNNIGIPPQLENFGELEKLLRQAVPKGVKYS